MPKANGLSKITTKSSNTNVTPVPAGSSSNNNGNMIDLDDLLGGFGSKPTTTPQTQQ